MKILISNDDGITSPGLHALVRAFSKAGHEIAVIAPDDCMEISKKILS